MRGFFTMKVVENEIARNCTKLHEMENEIARNCTILKKISWGACPQTPLTKARSFAARYIIYKKIHTKYIQNI